MMRVASRAALYFGVKVNFTSLTLLHVPYFRQRLLFEIEIFYSRICLEFAHAANLFSAAVTTMTFQRPAALYVYLA